MKLDDATKTKILEAASIAMFVIGVVAYIILKALGE